MQTKFGTDGIRGIANRELTPEVVLKIGRSAAYHLSEKYADKPKQILIGKDTRISGDLLEGALVAGICSIGVNVIKIGIIPTPGLAFLCKTVPSIGGIMVSASHNPIEDNGIKIFSPEGFKISDESEKEIEALLNSNDNSFFPSPVGSEIGRIRDDFKVSNWYETFLSSFLKNIKIEKNFVVDCANGASYKISHRLFKNVCPKAVFINNSNDGKKINVNCGSTRPEILAKKVLSTKSAFGFAFDGDADRVIFVDEKGNLVDGDQIMLVCAKDLIRKNQLKNNTVVTTVMSNMGFEKELSKIGGDMVRVKVGDKFVLEEMRQKNLSLGGEQSGHIIFLNHSSAGDGLLTAAIMLSIIANSDAPLSELAFMPKSFQTLKNIKVPNRELFKTNQNIQDKIKEVENMLDSNGRVVVRPSGTEPLIRIMVEAWEDSKAKECMSVLTNVIEQEL